MSKTLELMESCIAMAEAKDAASYGTLRERLKAPDWRVRYAAAIALGDLADAGAVQALLEILKQEDAAPIYGQKADYGGAHAGSNGEIELHLPELDNSTKEAWRRRGRIKQAACLALGQIGAPASPAVDILRRYAVDQGEDHTVRAAACKALGLILDKGSLKALEAATHDQEWCTKTEAAKSLAKLKSL